MIVKPELLKKIKHYFNINIYEAKVWMALLSRGVASAGEIAEISDVPRSRTYDVLESLEKQGFAIEKLGKPVKYIAVKPAAILEKLKNNASKEIDEKLDSLNKLKDTNEYGELETLYTQGISPVSAAELSGAVRGSGNVDAQMREMIDGAEKQIILVTTLNALKQEHRFLKHAINKIGKKGIDFKIAVNAKPEDLKNFEEYKNIISTTNLNSRFCIVDGKQTFFTLSDKHDEEIGVWINSPFFTETLKNLFESSCRK
ncbi:MAG: helix-turn-helix domain-containing protein [archaeon]